jgi:hypothetical protein
VSLRLGQKVQKVLRPNRLNKTITKYPRPSPEGYETLELFPEMGWGLPTSPGHYLDLVGAILGCTLLPLGFLGNAIVGRKNSK